MAQPSPESVILGSVKTLESGESEWTAELSLSLSAVVALTSAGDFAIPLKRLQIDHLVDGSLLLSDPEQEDWTISVRDIRLLDHPVLNRVPHLSLQIRRLKESATARRSRRLALIFLILFFVVIAALFSFAPSLVRFAVARIPFEVESALGAETARKLTNVVSVTEDQELAARLAAVTNRLAGQLRHLRPRCEFAILDTLEVNALALPGGRVFVTRGLLRAVDNGEELAGVIAHELAHVRQRHGLQRAVGSRGPMLALQLALGASPGPASALVEDSQELLGLRYSREAENEADKLGFQLLVAANIDPRGMLSFMRRLDDFDPDTEASTTRTTTSTKHGSSSGQRVTRPERVLRTHPLTPERVAHLEALWSETRRKTGFLAVPWSPDQGGRSHHSQ